MCVVVCGGGGGGSEFSGAWCKRGEGGQGREGVQLPDSLVDEAVLQLHPEMRAAIVGSSGCNER